MEPAISSGVVPLTTSFLVPSGRVTEIIAVWTVCGIGIVGHKPLSLVPRGIVFESSEAENCWSISTRDRRQSPPKLHPPWGDQHLRGGEGAGQCPEFACTSL